MRIITFILLLLLFNSCLEEKETDENRIRKFENLLGNQESQYLNEIINDFDLFLLSKYPSENKRDRFTKYLNDFVEKMDYFTLQTGNYFIIDSNKMLEYRNSMLFGKYHFEIPDTVWKDKYGINYKFKTDSLIETIIQPNDEKTFNEIRTKPVKIRTEISPFFACLDSIKENDSLVISYLWTIEDYLSLSPIAIADGLLYFQNDSSDYFAKRIFIMELNY